MASTISMKCSFKYATEVGGALDGKFYDATLGEAMAKVLPLMWLALSVVGLYGLRALNRRGNNLYSPTVSENERRRKNIRFAVFIFIYVVVVLASYFFKYFGAAGVTS